MALEIFDGIEQGSKEWHALHVGLPTASRFGAIMANSTERRMRASYLREKVYEELTGQACQTWDGNSDTLRGHEWEPRARAAYALVTPSVSEITQIGFALDLEKTAGCSPDGLCDDNGVVELKGMRGDLLIEILDKQAIPPSLHYWQCMGNLWILGRQWCDLVLFCPGLPLFVKRLARDVVACAELRKAIDAFNSEKDAMVEKIKRMGR